MAPPTRSWPPSRPPAAAPPRAPCAGRAPFPAASGSSSARSTTAPVCYGLGDMLAALIVGALTAWYLGLRAGVIAAAVTFAALVLAMFVPGLSLAVYALVIA